MANEIKFVDRNEPSPLWTSIARMLLDYSINHEREDRVTHESEFTITEVHGELERIHTADLLWFKVALEYEQNLYKSPERHYVIDVTFLNEDGTNAGRLSKSTYVDMLHSMYQFDYNGLIICAVSGHQHKLELAKTLLESPATQKILKARMEKSYDIAKNGRSKVIAGRPYVKAKSRYL